MSLVKKENETEAFDGSPEIRIGDWYWVKGEERGRRKKAKEYLACVEHIGSNYVGLKTYLDDNYDGHSSGTDWRVHLDNFAKECRPEPRWREIIGERVAQVRLLIQQNTNLLIKKGQDLMILPDPDQEKKEQKTFLPAKASDAPKKHKKQLLALRDKTMPEISKTIESLGYEHSALAKSMALPDLVKLERVKKALSGVDDRIFNIELYCGLQEEVIQIRKGKPAASDERIAVRQLILYMDEETLFDYRSGGMDFRSLKKFDKWVARPENVSRILPEPKGVVAFRVRRHEKDYGSPQSVAEALQIAEWHKENYKTYILIRNGRRLYRIASSIDFSPRLIPKKNEIGTAQFKKDRGLSWWSDKEEGEIITPEDVDYDDYVQKQDDLRKNYNRIVVLLQGLLDRSEAFHPHPEIKLYDPKQFSEWVILIRDEEDVLPSQALDWKEYQERLNSTLKIGKYIYISLNEKYELDWEGRQTGRKYFVSRGKEFYLKHHGWAAKAMPCIAMVRSIRRDRSAVKISWPKGENSSHYGYGWGRPPLKSNRMCHQWLPIGCVINLTDYTPGDYKLFLCNRSQKGRYNEWARLLLSAEEFARGNIKPREDQR